jgi:hypothetical protein
MVNEEIVDEYVMLRSRLTKLHTQLIAMKAEKATIEGQVSSIEALLTKTDLPALKALLPIGTYGLLERRITKLTKYTDPAMDLPWS